MRTRIFLAGASGAIGRPLTSMLVAAGYEVTGTARSQAGVARITAAGARAAIVDVFDVADLMAAMAASRPEVVIHEVTDLSTKPGESLTDDHLERNARVREVGTRNLVGASLAVGARRLVAQSIAWLYLPGPEPHTEEETIMPADPATMNRTRQAVIDLERMVTGDQRFEGVVLRYGRLYGPGTWRDAPDVPPTVHVHDAARAAVLAVEHGEPGIYNIANECAQISNAKARRLLGWLPMSSVPAETRQNSGSRF
ncbi:MAG TPA: NAD(P)-dependent oxidoreductase [Candidatus Limnocylindrales bacterium]|nr:NAD(P)-dependent oxidoreductase [Candidatus Limnocylindrales bacterium]